VDGNAEIGEAFRATPILTRIQIDLGDGDRAFHLNLVLIPRFDVHVAMHESVRVAIDESIEAPSAWNPKWPIRNDDGPDRQVDAVADFIRWNAGQSGIGNDAAEFFPFVRFRCRRSHVSGRGGAFDVHPVFLPLIGDQTWIAAGRRGDHLEGRGQTEAGSGAPRLLRDQELNSGGGSAVSFQFRHLQCVTV
jgi:hypothetical protein